MLKGPIVLLYMTICLCVLSDKKTFLVSALGLNWPHSDSRTNQRHLDHKLPGWVLFTVAQWKKMQRKKIHLNYFPKADFFSFLFLLKQETLRCKSKSRKYFTILKSHLQFGSVMNEILSTEHWWTAWPSVEAREGSSTQTRSQTVPGDTLAFSLLSVRSVPASVLPVKASKEGSWKLIWNAPLN